MAEERIALFDTISYQMYWFKDLKKPSSLIWMDRDFVNAFLEKAYLKFWLRPCTQLLISAQCLQILWVAIIGPDAISS